METGQWVTHIILLPWERSRQCDAVQVPDCSCEGQDVDFATGCWLPYLTHWRFASAGKSHVPSLLQCAGISAHRDLTFNLSTAQNDQHQQRLEMKSALSSASRALFAVSVIFQIFNFNFNEVALFDKGQCCQHRKMLKFKVTCLLKRLNFWIDDIY